MSAEPQGSLKSRIFKAGGWNILQILISNVLRLGSNLVMTRLLVPEAFGLMSFLMVIVTGFTLLSDIGINRSIIRDPAGNTPRYLRAAWVVQVWRGGFIAAGVVLTAVGVWFLAPHFAAEGTVYADPLLPFLLAAISLAPLIHGFKSTNVVLAQRNLQIRQVAYIEVIGQICAILFQIVVASIWPSVWSLIFGTIVGQAIKTAISHKIVPGPKMAWQPDKEIASQIWIFGKFLMVSSLLTFAARNADKFILASLLSSTSFGLVAIAQIWIEAGQTLLNKLADQIGFSALGEVIRTRPKEAARVFKRFQKAIDLFCVTCFLLCVFLAEPFIRLLYTETYYTAGHYLTLLGLVFLSLRFNAMGAFILNHGNSRAMMIISGIRAIAILILLPLGYTLIGIEGALLAVALTPLSSAPYTIWLIRPLLGEGYAARQVLWVVAILLTAVAVYLTY
ncbi:MAG: oligosaccharide flippase family protein [Pseudomonadota bacterium]|nr:oligosaccharide flippase family protein [Pseudomonadota bacterium]